MASSSVDKELETLIRARYPIIYIVSWEEQRVEEALREIARERGKKIFFWTITQGLVQNPNHRDNATKDPLNALDAVIDSRDQALFVLKDFHAFIGDVTVTRRLRDLTAALKTSYKTLIILAPVLRLPSELEKEIAVIDYGLPDHDDLDVILEKVIQAVKDNPQIDCKLTELERDQVLKAAQGLTAMEAENVFAKSLIEKHKFDVDVILGEKEQIIRKSGILEYYPFNEGISDVGGLDLLKGWMEKRTVAFTEKARDFGLPAPRGVLLLGVQGCGKSLSAKAIGSLWRLPLLRLDVGRIFAGIVGSSEENMRKAIRVAESVAPCVACDTRITLADGSERTIQSLYDGDERELWVMGMTDDWQITPVQVKAITRRPAPDLYTVRLKHGKLQATGNHLHPVLRDGELHWIRTDELTTNDHVAVPRQIPTRPDFPSMLEFLPSSTRLYFDGASNCSEPEVRNSPSRYPARGRNGYFVRVEELTKNMHLRWCDVQEFVAGSGGYGARYLKRIPERLNPDIGYLLGLIASDGYLGKHGRIGFINTDLTLHKLFADVLERQFGVCTKMQLFDSPYKNSLLAGTSEESVFRPCYTTYADSTLLNQILNKVQEQLLTMPSAFLNAWLRGYFDGDGYVSSDTDADPKIVLTSKRPVYNREIRAVLQRVGFAVTNPDSYNIEITGMRNVQRFITQIGSQHPCRRSRMDAWMEKPPLAQEKDRTDVIPVGARLRCVRQALGMGSQHFANTSSSLCHRYEHNLGHPNRERLQSMLHEMRSWAATRGAEIAELDAVQKLVDSAITWSKIVSIIPEDAPEYVYDLSCCKHYSFVANGIVSHNCVLWLDELEKGFSGTQSSGMSDGGTTSRVFGTFLTWMQDKKSPAFVVATSNDVTALPPELLRKGRFDEIFFIDLPAHEERKQILKIHLKKRKRNPEEFDLDRLSEVTPGFSGAEIEAVVVDALYDAFDETRELTTELIVAAAAHTVPLSMTMQERIEHLREWAATRARDASSARAEDLVTIKEQLLLAKATFNREHPEDTRAVNPNTLTSDGTPKSYGSDLESEED